MTDGKDTTAKTKPLISKENAQNRPKPDPGDGKRKHQLTLAALLSKGASLPFADEDESGEAAVLVCLVGASLSYMSIGTESHNKSPQYTNCCVKEYHTFSSFARFRNFICG